MTWYDVIAGELSINEPFELPDKLINCLNDKERRESLFDKVMEIESDLNKDVLSISFQEALGNRDKLMQDFTPDSICRIVANLTGLNNGLIADICAGTGGLTIRSRENNPTSHYYIEEISKATIPVLLFNLAIRNISATVIQGDSLTRERQAVYNVETGEKYSDIFLIDKSEIKKMDKVITNPPYSLTWKPQHDERFAGYELAPKTKADYAFILHGLHLLNDSGELLAILPHGVLFRGGAEKKIRRKLIENNLIDMVIGLPGDMFLNTNIPTTIIKFKKNRKNTDILFIDASKDCRKVGRFNVIDDDQIDKLTAVVKNRISAERYSRSVSLQEIEENNFNLNIPRYVDTSEPTEVPNLYKAMKDYVDITIEIQQTEKEIFAMMSQLIDSTPDGQIELDKAVKALEDKIEKYEQLELFGDF